MYNPSATFAKVAKSSHRGSRPGEHRGGRKKGTRNKRTLAQIAAAEGKLTPLDYMLSVMRDETEPLERRLECAMLAAPYMHAKLKQIEVGGRNGEPISQQVVLTFHDNV
jgi:hypothetical protein